MNDIFVPCCCCIHVYCDVCSWWLYNMLENYKLHHPCNDNTRAMQKQCFFFWVTNFGQEQLSLLFFVCAHIVHVMLHTHKCKLTQFPQKQNKKSDWCWQRWLCDWVTQLVKLQSFQGMLVTGVRFRFNKFPLSNIVVRCFHTLHSHRIFSIGEDNPHVGKALDRWWEALTSVGFFPVGWQKKMTKWFSTNHQL